MNREIGDTAMAPFSSLSREAQERETTKPLESVMLTKKEAWDVVCMSRTDYGRRVRKRSVDSMTRTLNET